MHTFLVCGIYFSGIGLVVGVILDTVIGLCVKSKYK
ncbi:hypothetical protein EDC55_1319 [Allofrancisella inopinata]|nr:hypothetical protein EDC55_1319 [Allofrancisella inopinata]